MKTTAFWALIGLGALPTLGQPTGTSAEPSTTSGSCTASQVTTLCDYPTPGPEFAVASGGRSFCWEYCNAHAPCSFVIFVAGNPYTGTGTCWLYPGQNFDASKGSSKCGNPSLFVYDKPVCSGGSTATPTSGSGCPATASPSAVAEVCGYPPPGDCFDSCAASSGATDCLSQCAKADACSYVVFNPRNPGSSSSQYGSGTCWMYNNGTYDAGSAAKCSGAPEQFVYKNLCPKPSTSTSKSATASATGSAIADGARAASTTSENSAPTGLSLHPLAIGVAALVWQGI